MSRDDVYLRHVAEAIEKIERYVANLTRETFAENDLVVDGVVRELEIIGEAVSNVSERFRGQHPEIPFAEIIGMRNRLTHEYFGVDFDIVWKTVQDDLPVLKAKVQGLFG